MIIANPLYDTAFKGVIGNEKVAAMLIATLLGKKVVSIETRPTERPKPQKEDDKRPSCVRLDYVVVIMDSNGNTQKLIIEMQKASGADTIYRFREYLALAGYGKQEKEEENLLPIITIYFLGFELKNVHTPCLSVSRQYIDMMTNTVLHAKEKFVELLTHDTIIVQAPRINTVGEPKTDLERLLSIFEQKNFTNIDESTIDYQYPFEDNEGIKGIVDILHFIGTDPQRRKELENEAYWKRYDDLTAGELMRAQDENKELKNELADKDAELEKLRLQIAEFQAKPT
jgi:hypothetical protein